MQRSVRISLIGMIGLAAAGCATTTPPATTQMAEAHAGLTCRGIGTRHERCLTAAQWEQIDRRTAQRAGDRAQAASMGAAMQEAAAAQAPYQTPFATFIPLPAN